MAQDYDVVIVSADGAQSVVKTQGTSPVAAFQAACNNAGRWPMERRMRIVEMRIVDKGSAKPKFAPRLKTKADEFA